VLDAKVTGIQETTAKLDAARRRHEDAFRAAEFVVAGELLTELLPGVPFATGELRDSRFVTRASPAQAGFAAEHALVTHEVGQHKKYLQRPMSTLSSSVPDRIARHLPRFVEAGTTLATAPTQHPERPDTIRRRRPRIAR
jgi:hypothetical protein